MSRSGQAAGLGAAVASGGGGGGVAGDAGFSFSGMRMLVVHPRHRTVLPRADDGTARILRHVRFGHMTLSVSSAIRVLPSVEVLGSASRCLRLTGMVQVPAERGLSFGSERP